MNAEQLPLRILPSGALSEEALESVLEVLEARAQAPQSIIMQDCKYAWVGRMDGRYGRSTYIH